MAFSLACDTGKTTLRIEGIDSNVTWNDVANAGAGSVAVDGGGTEDPSFFVTEHVANGMYQILKNIQFGDGSNALTFKSANECVYFDGGCVWTIQNYATLQLGVLVGDYGYDGSYWSFAPGSDYIMISETHPNANFKVYASIVKNRDNYYYLTGAGTFQLRDAMMEFTYDPIMETGSFWYILGGTIDFKRSLFCNTLRLEFRSQTTLNFIDVHVNRAYIGIRHNIAGSPIDATVENFDCSSIDTYKVVEAAAATLTFHNPKATIIQSDVSILDEGGVVKVTYSCDIHVVDKDGANLQGVTVLCEDKNSNQVFSVQTGADGKIAQQIITYKKWEGTAETETEYSPHEFTFSKNGYTLLVMENVTVDARINWDIEVKFPERIRARMANPGRLAILR